MSTHVVVGLGDMHAGGTTAICPPEGFELDDGGRQMPNPIQSWLYKQWEDAWSEQYPRILDTYKPDSQTLILNGDMVDGIHHKSPQVAPLVGQHFRTAITCLERGPGQHKPDKVHLVRGTESHVGRSGELEEGIARALRAEGWPMVPDPDTAQVSSFWRRIDVDGVLIDVRHHGRMGQRAHTRGPYQRWYAQDIALEHMLDGEQPPTLAIRSHLHKYGDSGKDHRWPTRLVSLPCWQMMTAYAHRITAESLSDIGMVVFVVRDGVLLEPEPILYKPDRPKVIVA